MELRNHKYIMYPKTGLTIVFDVETTGLLPKKKKSESKEFELEEYPYITQLSYVIYDKYNKKVIKIANHYVQIPKNIMIPEIVTKITGITKEICEEKGISIINILMEFYRDIHNCDMIVAHNYAFDYQIIQAEMKRNYRELEKKCPNALILFTPEYLEKIGKRIYCTMKMSIYICKLPFKTGGGYKFPKLSELHQHLFGFVPENLHDALIDVETCLRCYNRLVE